jgi:hypothetical protein
MTNKLDFKKILKKSIELNKIKDISYLNADNKKISIFRKVTDFLKSDLFVTTVLFTAIGFTASIYFMTAFIVIGGR